MNNYNEAGQWRVSAWQVYDAERQYGYDWAFWHCYLPGWGIEERGL